MKILVICQYFFPEQFKVNDICNELAHSGHQVTVLTGLPNYPTGVVEKKYKWFKNRDESIDGVEVIRSWLIGRKKGNINLGLNYLSFAFSSMFKVLFMKKDFDLILVYQLSPVTMALPGVLMKKLISKPLIIYCHDLWPESIVSAGVSSKGVLYSLLLKFCKWIYKKADQLLISSKLFEEYFSSVLGI
ncbi:glycosyltransferase family 4 protein, partial [Paenibacillus sp. P3E]|uniref:glycosyltransferase family 4 protein n=1 Tax=Paenibacillus sp. P3E TaxID=1349435 RepID=UPI000AAA7E94